VAEAALEETSQCRFGQIFRKSRGIP